MAWAFQSHSITQQQTYLSETLLPISQCNHKLPHEKTHSNHGHPELGTASTHEAGGSLLARHRERKALFVAIIICVFSNNRAVKSIRRNCCVGMVTVSGAKQISAHKWEGKLLCCQILTDDQNSILRVTPQHNRNCFGWRNHFLWSIWVVQRETY